jgi:shikimate kinase
MGTGKTTVGNRLAEILGFTFVDTDREIEERTGKSITRLFSEDGEAYFRDLESEVIEEVSTRSKTVISSGGGSVVRPENLQRLRQSGLVVCLSATPEVVLQRIQGAADRPLLRVSEPLKEIERLLQLRESGYSMAHLTVDTSSALVDQVVDRVHEAYRHFLQEGS